MKCSLFIAGDQSEEGVCRLGSKRDADSLDWNGGDFDREFSPWSSYDTMNLGLLPLQRHGGLALLGPPNAIPTNDNAIVFNSFRKMKGHQIHEH
jgi:hypothetical protein